MLYVQRDEMTLSLNIFSFIFNAFKGKENLKVGPKSNVIRKWDEFYGWYRVYSR